MLKENQIRDEAMETLAEFGLNDVCDEHAASMSRGNKRRLELAMGLIQHPELLLLDEPTAGMARLDTNNTIELLKTGKFTFTPEYIKEKYDTEVIPVVEPVDNTDIQNKLNELYS